MRTHARMHARTHTRTHARTHACTHMTRDWDKVVCSRIVTLARIECHLRQHTVVVTWVRIQRYPHFCFTAHSHIICMLSQTQHPISLPQPTLPQPTLPSLRQYYAARSAVHILCVVLELPVLETFSYSAALALSSVSSLLRNKLRNVPARSGQRNPHLISGRHSHRNSNMKILWQSSEPLYSNLALLLCCQASCQNLWN